MREKEQLIKLRSEVAKRSGQSTYLVPNDKEIEVLLKVRPKTIQELTALKGFPLKGKRVASYGQAIVDIFTKDIQQVNYTGAGDSIRVVCDLKPSSIW